MSKKRSGSIYAITDRGRAFTLTLQPIIPKGYVILRNLDIIYGGIVFNHVVALEHINHIKDAIEKRAKIWGDKACNFRELTHVVVSPKEAPKGTLRSMINAIEETAEETTTASQQQLQEADAPLKAETRVRKVVTKGDQT